MRHFIWRLFPWIFLLAGVATLGAIYWKQQQESLLDQLGIQVVGTVQWSSRHSKSCAKSIRVAYVASGGRTFTKYFSVCSHLYQPGDRVEVIYLPSDPELATLSSHEAVQNPKTRNLVGSVVGALFTAVGALLLIALRGKPKGPKQRQETDA
jgi:hypothetical protein